jgi:hypothetical protein
MEDWASAELRGDTAFLESFLADDFVCVGSRGFTLTKEQWLACHQAGNLRYEYFRLDEVRARLCGDAAVIIVRQTMKGKYEDNALPGDAVLRAAGGTVAASRKPYEHHRRKTLSGSLTASVRRKERTTNGTKRGYAGTEQRSTVGLVPSRSTFLAFLSRF